MYYDGDDDDGDSGLGGYASGAMVAGNIVGAAFGVPEAGQMVALIAQFLQVGRGRNEADQITPTQNQFGDFLAQASAYVPVAPNVGSLQTLANNLSQGWTKFQSFLNNRQQFPDGRASGQSFRDMQPLVNTIQSQIADRMRQLGGTSGLTAVQAGVMSLVPSFFGVPNLPQSGTLPYYPPTSAGLYAGQPGFLSSPWVPVAIVGGLAWFLFGRKSG